MRSSVRRRTSSGSFTVNDGPVELPVYRTGVIHEHLAEKRFGFNQRREPLAKG